MPLKIARLNLNSMPQPNLDLGVQFDRQRVTKIKGATTEMILLRPASGLLAEQNTVGPEPRWNLVMCGLRLRTRDGILAEGSGQLAITAQRVIGMIDSGSATDGPISMARLGSGFCFAFHRDDVYEPIVERHRLRPSEYSFLAKDELTVPFHLLVFAAVAFIANGKMSYWHDRNMDYALSAEGREALSKT